VSTFCTQRKARRGARGLAGPRFQCRPLHATLVITDRASGALLALAVGALIEIRRQVPSSATCSRPARGFARVSVKGSREGSDRALREMYGSGLVWVEAAIFRCRYRRQNNTYSPASAKPRAFHIAAKPKPAYLILNLNRFVTTPLQRKSLLSE